jgi:hypothetical protein
MRLGNFQIVGLLMALLGGLVGQAQTEDYYALTPRARTSSRSWAVTWEASALVTGKATLGLIYELADGTAIYGKALVLLPYFKTGFLLSDLAYEYPENITDASGWGVTLGFKRPLNANTLGAQKGMGGDFTFLRAHHATGFTYSLQMNPHFFYQKPLSERWYAEVEAGFALAAFSFSRNEPQNISGVVTENTKLWINPTVRLSVGWLL